MFFFLLSPRRECKFPNGLEISKACPFPWPIHRFDGVTFLPCPYDKLGSACIAFATPPPVNTHLRASIICNREKTLLIFINLQALNLPILRLSLLLPGRWDSQFISSVAVKLNRISLIIGIKDWPRKQLRASNSLPQKGAVSLSR